MLVRVAGRGDLVPGQGKLILARGREIALFNVEGTFYAVRATCPHEGGPLAQASLSGTVITCPWHRWQFDLATGNSVNQPDAGVRCYPVVVRGDAIFVEIS